MQPDRTKDGRYLIKPPKGRRKGYTRVSSYASRAGLEPDAIADWRLRRSLRTVAESPALQQSIVDCDDNYSCLKAISEQVEIIAGNKTAAEIGTYLHSLAEDVFTGWRDIDRVPELVISLPDQQPIDPLNARDRVRCLVDALEDAGVVVLKDHVEQVIVNHDLVYAGTVDYIVKYKGSLVIADLKTGGSIRESVPPQLAAYANHTHLYDPLNHKNLDPADVSKEIALVAHLPAYGTGCEIVEVPIVDAWEQIRHIHQTIRISADYKGKFLS